jgi:hypothetical protein
MLGRLAVLGLTGCSLAAADASYTAGNVTPYACDALIAADENARTDPGILAPWTVLAGVHQVDSAWVARVQALADEPLPALTVEERVRLQHRMLLVARELDKARRDNPAWLGWRIALADVMTRIEAIAPTGDELASLGRGTRPHVATILGRAEDLIERATQTCDHGGSKHVRATGGVLAFRPLRAGTTRALVSQIVAFDATGKPHITPLVEGAELRFGSDDRAAACVVRAGDDGVLRAVAYADLHTDSRFVQRRGDGVGCAGCHRGSVRARDLGADEVPAIDAARDAQVERLAESLWTRLSD